LALIIAAVLWLKNEQRQRNRETAAINEEAAKLRQGVNRFVEVQTKASQEQPGQNVAQVQWPPDGELAGGLPLLLHQLRLAEAQRRTYEELARQLGVDPKLLQEKLPQFARGITHAPAASVFERANAAYVGRDYSEAESLALAAAAQAQNASPPKISDSIRALDLAGDSAEARTEYADALKHYLDAGHLTDHARDPLEWARQQRNIADVLADQGKYAESEIAYRNALKEYQRAHGDEDKAVLSLRNSLAGALAGQGKHAEAEMEHRAVLKLREKLLGPEHPDTLASRNNLAYSLFCQQKYAEAETEYREVIRLEDKVLGSEHSNTLASRMYLAVVFDEQVKYAEAETQYRELLKAKEKVLGPEHPDTLTACYNLALCLKSEKKSDEAKVFARRAAEGAQKILGANHPYTVKYEKLRQELQTTNSPPPP